MKSQSLSKKVVTDTSHLYCIASEITASVCKSSSKEGNWIVSLCHNKHSNESLVSIDNEITTKLSHVFFSANHVYLV